MLRDAAEARARRVLGLLDVADLRDIDPATAQAIIKDAEDSGLIRCTNAHYSSLQDKAQKAEILQRVGEKLNTMLSP